MTAKIVQIPETPTTANSVNLQISLPEMLDLALGSPEVGAVNFNILHTFLYILLHQINLQATKVEYHGENADRIKKMVTRLKPSPALHETIIDAISEIPRRIRRDEGVDADVLTEDIQLPMEEILMKEEKMKQIELEKIPEAPTIIAVVTDAPPAIGVLERLEETVRQLEQRCQALEELLGPKVIESLKDKIPAADLLQFSERLDVNEQGINKLTIMLQNIIKGDISITDISLINARLNELEDKVSKMTQWFINLQTVTDYLTEAITGPTTDIAVAAKVKEEIEAAKIAAVEEKEKIVEITPTTTIDVAAEEKEEIEAAEITAVETVLHKKEEKEIEISKPVVVPKAARDKLAAQVTLLNGNAVVEIRQDITTLKTDVAHKQQELAEIRQDVTTLKTDVAHKQQELQDLSKRVAQLQIKEKEEISEVPVISAISDVASFEQCMDAIKNVDTTYGKAMKDVTQRVVALDTKIGYVLEKVENMQKISTIDEANKLVAKMQGIEIDMKKIEQIMDRLLDDKEKQDTNVNTLLEQIEFLKIVKASKGDLEDALAYKADTQTVNRKVSHDRFDAACDDLSRGLEEAINKLEKQESIWQQALEEVQNEIITKMDKIEMPLKDFVNNKLKSLQDKLKVMIEARREIEAAGTKKLLRDVQCISCNKDVVMKTEEVDRFRSKPLICTTSIKPYLTYELDKIRKQLKKLPHGRNMVQFEAIMQEELRKMKEKEEMVSKIPRDHLCNRYCGGSHTITSPQQRVMRTGHFLAQWGPETIQLTDGLIKGKDGQMYRSRLIPDKDVCGPDWESQISMAPEPSECTMTTFRKSLPSQRNSVKNQKQNSRKRSKEAQVSEPEEKSTMRQVTSLQKSGDHPPFVPVGLQDSGNYIT